MRSSYKRSDFKILERGKFHAEAQKGTSGALSEKVAQSARRLTRKRAKQA